MTLSEIVNTIGMIAALGFSIYAAVRKQGTADAKNRLELTAEEEEAKRKEDEAVGVQWRTYAKSREQLHKADIDRIECRVAENERQIAELTSKERACFERATALEAENKLLKDQMRQFMKLPPGSGTHQSLQTEGESE